MKVTVNDKNVLSLVLEGAEYARLGSPPRMIATYDHEAHRLEVVAGSGPLMQKAHNASGHHYWNRSLNQIYKGLRLGPFVATVIPSPGIIGDQPSYSIALPGERPKTLVDSPSAIATLRAAIERVNAAVAAVPGARLHLADGVLRATVVREVEL